MKKAYSSAVSSQNTAVIAQLGMQLLPVLGHLLQRPARLGIGASHVPVDEGSRKRWAAE